jgi:hypothetical protein
MTSRRFQDDFKMTSRRFQEEFKEAEGITPSASLASSFTSSLASSSTSSFT